MKTNTTVNSDTIHDGRAEDNQDVLSSRQKAILLAIPNIIMEVDLNKIYTWANQPGIDFFGEDVIGKQADFYFEGHQDVFTVVQPIFEGSEDTTYVESWQRRKDGEKRLLAWWCRTLKDSKGNVIGAISSAQDITASKQAEDRLRQSEAALKKAQQVSHVGSWVWYVKTNKLEWSDEMFHIFGIDKEKFSGDLTNVINSAIHPDDRKKVEEANRAVVKKKQSAPLEYRVVWPDGIIRIVWAEAGELVLDDAGETSILTGIVQDITERKQAEQLLKDEIEKLDKMNQLIISRELRMVELKKEITDLDDEILSRNKKN